jgi:hypothetical protein
VNPNLKPSRLNVLFLSIVICSCTATVYGQNLESIGKEKPFTISGGVSATQIFYTASGINSRRDPYSYFLSGNVNFGLYGWTVPLSFSLSNQNVSFQQPFNQYSLHPTYKWITAHIGYANMTFSPYTLSGHIFRGVGVDLAPTGNLKINAMYGRLQRAVNPDTLADAQAAFKRMGYGLKINYGSSARFVEVIGFRAKDEINSINFIPDDNSLLPQQNLVFSIGGGYTFFERISLKSEFASTGITRDSRAEESEGEFPFNYVGNIFTPRISTSYYQAMKGSLSYEGNGYTVGVGYERIDPEYRTLGAYYFNNDLENITVNGATALAGGKVNVAASVGVQRDNLDKSQIATMRRWVSSTNVGFVPNERLNMALSYSNFQTFTNIRSQFVDINQLTPYDNLDTLNFTQISQNANLNANYLLSQSKEKRKSLSANISVMKAADKQNEVTQNSGTMFYNMNTSYSVNITPKDLTVSASFNYSLNQAMGSNSSTLGPSISVSKSLMEKKLRISGSCSGNDTYLAGSLTNRVMSIRGNTGYAVKQKHNFSLSIVALTRTSKKETGAEGFREFTATLGYSYSFGAK